MLIASLRPLLARYSLGLDLIAGLDDTVTLTIIPRKVDGAARNLDAGETRPISITASAAEIDAELARGADGALGQLIATRRTLADQIAEQRQAADAAKQAAADAAKTKTAAPAPRPSIPAGVATATTSTSTPATARADEPASLFRSPTESFHPRRTGQRPCRFASSPAPIATTASISLCRRISPTIRRPAGLSRYPLPGDPQRRRRRCRRHRRRACRRISPRRRHQGLIPCPARDPRRFRPRPAKPSSNGSRAMMATRPALSHRPAARRVELSMPRSFPVARAARGATGTSRSLRRQNCGSRRSADLAGRSVALSPEIPAIFDAPLGHHHTLIGRWVAAQERSVERYTCVAARCHIERTFGAAVRDILDPVDLADLRITVLGGEDDRPPALAIVCDSVGQLDLGWIETGDAPIAWRAMAYAALEYVLGRVLPVFGYEDLFEQIALYYWDGETDDEAARQSLIFYHGVDEEDLDHQTLPSTMNARRPEWMTAGNTTPPAPLPTALRRRLETLRHMHGMLGDIPPEHDAWHVDHELVCDYIPDVEECSSLPPLTLVPFEQFACELDDVARHGMETGFMDVAGLCPLPDACRIDDWFASLRLGARFLCAVQDLIRFDPND